MMELLAWLNDVTLVIADPVLNWLLNMPRDVTLVVIALGTSFLMAIVRKWTTDQELLGRCDADKKRLKELIREAKKNKDKEAVARYRASVGMIGMKSMTAELKPLLWIILPIAILGTWAFNRVGFFAPEAGKPVQVIGYFPLTDCGELVHLLPQEGVEVVESENEKGWIREISEQELTEDQKASGLKPDGVATWTIKASASEVPHKLKIRYGSQTFEMDHLVGQKKYSMNFVVFSDTGWVPSAEVRLTEYKPFGLVPGIPALMCPAWLIGYMVIAVVMVFVIKPLLRIY